MHSICILISQETALSNNQRPLWLKLLMSSVVFPSFQEQTLASKFS